MPSTNKVSEDTKKRGRGRPRRLDRAAGVAAAEALFHRHGYDGLGIVAICDAIGVRQPAMYAAYGSKAALFERALARYAAGPYATFVGESIDGATAPAGALRTVLDAAARLYASDPDRTGCLALETSTTASDPEARQAAMDLVETVRATLAARYAGLGAEHPEAWADATIVGMRGLSGEARAGRSADALVEAVEIMAARS